MAKYSTDETEEAKDPGLALMPEGIADGLDSTEPEIVRWVANNIDNPGADPKNCPAPIAWTLLRLCRSHTEFQVMFIEKIWAKLLAKAQKDEEPDSRQLDGHIQIETIHKIREMRDKANKDCGVAQRSEQVTHNHHADGSNPSSAISFDEYDPEEDEDA